MDASPEELSEKIAVNEASIADLNEKIDEQIKASAAGVSDPSHLSDGETGFNPTAAELASVFEGIKKQIKALGDT
jgi:hypothetical protein